MKVIRLSELLSVVRLPPNAEACPMVSVSDDARVFFRHDTDLPDCGAGKFNW